MTEPLDKVARRDESAMVILETKRLSKNFGGLKALDRLDLQIYQGEILGLIGPNGSGKTTYLNVITGFLKPTAGDLLYRSQSIVGLKPHQIAERGVIRTFQLTSLFPNLTVEENIIAGMHLKTKGRILGSFFNTRSYREEEMRLRQKAADILTFMEMQERQGMLAMNLPAVEQRKLEIAIALAGEPNLLLLDEPAAGMNPEESVRLLGLIRSIQQMGITILIIEHNMRVIMRLCTRVAVINYGVKIAEGTPQEISNNDEVISVYLGRSRGNA